MSPLLDGAADVEAVELVLPSARPASADLVAAYTRAAAARRGDLLRARVRRRLARQHSRRDRRGGRDRRTGEAALRRRVRPVGRAGRPRGRLLSRCRRALQGHRRPPPPGPARGGARLSEPARRRDGAARARWRRCSPRRTARRSRSRTPAARSSSASAAAAGESRSTDCASWGCSRDAGVRSAARRGRVRAGRRPGGGPERPRSSLRRSIAERVHGRGSGGLEPGGLAGRRGTRAGRCGARRCRSRSRTTWTSTRRSTTRRTSAACSGRTPSPCFRTGGICPSGTTDAPERWCRAARPCGGRAAGAPTRVRAERTPRHRAGGRLRDRHPEHDGRAGAHRARARPRVRHGAGERLVRARHPGLGVPAARPVPRQVVRHVGEPLGRAARPARRPPRAARAARTRSRSTTCARSPGPSTSRSRSS